jgi:phage gp29-like protein
MIGYKINYKDKIYWATFNEETQYNIISEHLVPFTKFANILIDKNDAIVLQIAEIEIESVAIVKIIDKID